MKRKHVFAALSCMLLLLLCAGMSASAAYGPMFRKQNDQVTISREEYESLLKYQKISIVNPTRNLPVISQKHCLLTPNSLLHKRGFLILSRNLLWLNQTR